LSILPPGRDKRLGQERQAFQSIASGTLDLPMSIQFNLFACLAVMALAVLPMVAAADEWSSCVKLSDDLAVAGCSRAIDSHQYTGRSLARLYARCGGAYQAQGDLDHAMADFNESMRVDPTYPSAYNNRGITWYRRGDLDRAIAEYDQAIRLDPKYEYAYANRGNVWRNKRDFDRAIGDYDQAIRLDPKDAATYYNRGRAWSDKGDHDRAIADYDQAIRLDPKLPRPTPVAAMLRAARATSTAPSPTMTKRSGSIRKMPKPTTTAALRGR
jgi:tetratricopeptide (TPR) repeat protein